MVILDMKLKRIKNAATIKVANICPQTPTLPLTPTLGMGSEGQNSTFSEHCHVGYEIEVPVDKHFTPSP